MESVPPNLFDICTCLCMSSGVGGGDRGRMKEGGGGAGGLGDPRPDVERRFQPNAAVRRLSTAVPHAIFHQRVIMLSAFKL